MSTSPYSKVENINIHAQCAYGILRLIVENLTEPKLRDEDENIYYAIECACRELMTIRKAAEDYMDESDENALNSPELKKEPR